VNLAVGIWISKSASLNNQINIAKSSRIIKSNFKIKKEKYKVKKGFVLFRWILKLLELMKKF
jgi:hypothetical protein